MDSFGEIKIHIYNEYGMYQEELRVNFSQLKLMFEEDNSILDKVSFTNLLPILSSQKVPEQFLEQASKQNDDRILLTIIANPKLSVAILRRLVKHKSSQVSQAASLHVNYVEYIQSQPESNSFFGEDKSTSSISRIFYSHIVLNLACLSELIPIEVRDVFFSSQNYPQYLLDDFDNKDRLYKKFYNESWHGHSKKARVTQNSDTSINLLQELARDKDKYIRSCVAKNPNLPIELYQKLAFDKQKVVRIAVAKNPNTPASILELLAKRKYGVLREIAGNVSTPQKVLIELINTQHLPIFYLLAKNPQTPDFTLRELFEIDNDKLRRYIAKNPNTPIDIIEKLAHCDCSKIRFNLAHNQKLSTEILLRLIREEKLSQEYGTAHLVAKHPHADETIFNRLIKLNYSNTFFDILFHRNCTLKVTKYLLSSFLENIELPSCDRDFGSGSLGRLATCFSSSTESSILESYVNSPYWLERYAIATNPNTPRKIKKLLSQDANVLVRSSLSSPLTIS